MTKGRLHPVIRNAALALGILASANLAHAGAVYRGHIDPPPLYAGFVDVNVPATCVLITGWIAAGTDPGECGAVDFVSALLTNEPTNTDSIVFGFFGNSITGLLWGGGVLLAIDSTPAGVAGTGLIGFGNSAAGGVYPHVNPGYSLEFFSGHFGGSARANLYCDNSSSIDLDRVSKNYEHTTSLPCELNFGGVAASQEGFVQVPEPGSLALLLAGLAAGWLGYGRTRRM